MENLSSSTASTSKSSMSEEGSIIVRKSGSFRIEFPFTLKVGQVFTGFGVGCGLGIGVGRPINLSAIPMLNQVMSAASGATHTFSGIGRHVNHSLKKIGAKNIEAGIGCGVGFGHGFGEVVSKMMVKFGATPYLSIGQGLLPPSVQSGMTSVHGSSQDHYGSIAQFGKKISDMKIQGSAGDEKVNAGIENFRSEDATSKLSLDTRTDKVIDGFLQDPVLRGESSELSERDEQLESENRVLRMVVKHQQVIEELMEENEKLRQVLVKDLKLIPVNSKLSILLKTSLLVLIVSNVEENNEGDRCYLII
ncbi:5-formaminoimidazole-4-carboxamide-1-(beta)-D-ribofuranosyl 5'-monophosphate synthetase [Bienertia sinuspersici]